MASHAGRLGQERAMNEKEAAQQQARIDAWIAEGRDEYDVKKQVGAGPV